MKNNIIRKARHRYDKLYPESLVETITVTPKTVTVENKNGTINERFKTKARKRI